MSGLTFVWSLIEYENNYQRQFTISLTLFKMRCSPSGITCFGIAVARMEKPIRIWRNMSARILRRSCIGTKEKKRKDATEREKGERSLTERLGEFTRRLSYVGMKKRQTSWNEISLATARVTSTSAREIVKQHTPPPSALVYGRTRRDDATDTDETRPCMLIVRTKNVRQTFSGRCSLPEKTNLNESTASTWTAAVISSITEFL